MNHEVIADGASRFAVYVEELTKMIGPADRARPLRRCCAGLLASEGRRSVEPMAAVLRFQLRPAPQPIGWARALPACGAHRIDEAPQDDPQKRC